MKKSPVFWEVFCSPTCHVRGVERVKREREDVLSIALLPQLGARVPIPQNDVVGRMDG